MKPSFTTALTDAYVEIAHPRSDYRTDEGKKAREFLAPILTPYIKNNSEVLDLGCGMGGFTFLVETLGGKATGIDCSNSAIEFASTIADEMGSMARFVVGDFTALPFGDGSFDLVLFPNNIVECSYEEMENIAVETKRVLRVGGIFVLTMRDDVKLLHTKGVSGNSLLELTTGKKNGIVNIPGKGTFDYPTFFWTVGFAIHVVGRHLGFVKAEGLYKNRELLVFSR